MVYFSGLSSASAMLLACRWKSQPGWIRTAVCGLQLLNPCGDQVRPERVLAVRVRRRHDGSRAAGRRDLEHAQAVLDLPRPIVQPVEDVAVDVDEAGHGATRLSETTPRSTRRQNTEDTEKTGGTEDTEDTEGTESTGGTVHIIARRAGAHNVHERIRPRL